MSIQVLTDFKADTQICICADNSHMEIFSEGKGGDLIKSLAKATAQILMDLGQKYAKHAEDNGIDIELAHQKGELSEGDKGELAIIGQFKQAFDYEIAVCKIDQTAEKLGCEVPDFLKQLILDGLKGKLKEAFEGGEDDNE